jgi:hypothetical protein
MSKHKIIEEQPMDEFLFFVKKKLETEGDGEFVWCNRDIERLYTELILTKVVRKFQDEK